MRHRINIQVQSEEADKSHQFYFYSWPNAGFCIHYVGNSLLENGLYDDKSPCVAVEVYRIPPIPEKVLNPYIVEAATFITGDRKPTPEFKYELIYSDPPR
jgi:hypothetical protein